MRLKKILIMGIVSMSMVGTANAAVYGTLKSEDQTDTIKIIAQQEESYIVAIHEDIQATVPIEDVELLGKLSYTTAEETKLREEASPTADIIGFFEEEQLVLVIERQDDFYKVRTENQEGYIYKSQLQEDGLAELPYTKTEWVEVKEQIEESKQEQYIGEEVVSYAKQFLGGRYVYGGNSLTNGVDCSGFTQQVMKHFGVNIQRSSRTQYASNGYKVSEQDLLPGDLVFYGSNGRTIDHVAIYAGNGQIIHASDAKTGIKMSDLRYGKPLIGIKRVLN